MALVQLPVRSDLPAYRFQVALDFVRYTFDFEYNSRTDRWVFSVLDTDLNPIVSGVKLSVGIPLLNRFVLDTLPQGLLLAFDTSGEKLECGRDDLGSRVVLLYEEVEG